MDLGLAGRACIVTGGSRGFGYAVAERLVAERAGVLLIGRGREELDAAIDRLSSPLVACLAIDVTEPTAADQIVSACRGRFGRLDVLVNNAGGSAVTPMEELTDADWQSQLDQHVLAPMRLMRAAAPVMAGAGWGRIVNVTSSSGKRPSSMNPAYGVAKSAELALSRAFAEHWAPRGVLVNAVAPGPAATELWTGRGGMGEQLAGREGSTIEAVVERLGRQLPLGRVAEAGEIADVVAFLCSERCSTVVGAAWSADGGAVRTIV
ncbi:MAG: SDR family oxidoreductase [Solirubrobacteraceae bacterium]|nr:SDR family oxidoreductase [Solirubrobacteraceae bacterium]